MRSFTLSGSLLAWLTPVQVGPVCEEHDGHVFFPFLEGHNQCERGCLSYFCLLCHFSLNFSVPLVCFTKHHHTATAKGGS